MILQRTQRHDLFSAPVAGSVAPAANYTLQVNPIMVRGSINLIHKVFLKKPLTMYYAFYCLDKFVTPPPY